MRPGLHPPACGVLVEVTDRLVQAGGVKPCAVQNRHGRQQPAARDVLAHEATEPLGLGPEPGGPNRSRTTHRRIQPPVVAVEVHPAAGQTPPAARGHVKCPAEPLVSHRSILSRQSGSRGPPMTVTVPQLPRGSNPPASQLWPSLTITCIST